MIKDGTSKFFSSMTWKMRKCPQCKNKLEILYNYIVRDKWMRDIRCKRMKCQCGFFITFP